MNLFKNMSITLKISLGFIVFLVMLLVMGAFLFINLMN